MPPTEADIQNVMLEATLNAGTLLKDLLEKRTLSNDEKNAADTALRFLEMTSQASRTA